MATSRDRSAGILLYRRGETGLQVFIGHMGGPFWARKDAGAWSIPKGLVEDGEDALATALREFAEEIGTPPPPVEYTKLGDFRYISGKTVTVFAGEADFAVTEPHSNTFEIEWPRGSGRMHTIKEIDAVRWCTLDEARDKLVKGQVAALDALSALAG